MDASKQWCASKYFNKFLWGAVIYSLCQLLWYKCSHHGWFLNHHCDIAESEVGKLALYAQLALQSLFEHTAGQLS